MEAPDLRIDYNALGEIFTAMYHDRLKKAKDFSPGGFTGPPEYGIGAWEQYYDDASKSRWKGLAEMLDDMKAGRVVTEITGNETFEFFKKYPMFTVSTDKQQVNRFLPGTIVCHKEDLASGIDRLMRVISSAPMNRNEAEFSPEYFVHLCAYKNPGDTVETQKHFSGQELVEYKFVSPYDLINIWKCQPAPIMLQPGSKLDNLAQMGLIADSAAGLVITDAGKAYIEKLLGYMESEAIRTHNGITGLMENVNTCGMPKLDWNARHKGSGWDPVGQIKEEKHK